MVKVVLIDDEYYALHGLKMEIESINGIQVTGIFEDGEDALDYIKVNQPDIVFLDIEMPRINGLQLFQQILNVSKNSKIVFITAYNQYAVEAFELNALDYLIKPVQRSRLIKTVERFKLEFGKEMQKKKAAFRCFLTFTILIQEKELNIHWRTKKSEELLAYLICQEGRFVSKGKIAENLWTEENAQKSLSNLYLSYYHLKQQFKKEDIILPIESKRGKMRIMLENINVDINNFKDYLEHCFEINDETIIFAEKAAEIYKGDLLEENYYTWTLELQQKYAILYEELLEKIIEYYKINGNNRKYNYYQEKLNSF